MARLTLHRPPRAARHCLAALAALCLAACSANSMRVEPRPPFETVRGIGGGNEFEPQRPQAPDVATPATPAAPALAPAVAAPPAAAPPAVAITESPPVRLPAPLGRLKPPAEQGVFQLDANAFSAVFGTVTGPVLPTSEQLMQFDSLSLVAAESLRVELQKTILACRRAGPACRLSPR